MQNLTGSYTDEIIRYLVEQGARNFATDWLSLVLVLTGNKSTPTMILAPTGAALDQLAAESNRTFEEIFRLREGIDILENHLSVVPTQKVWPMVTSINDRQFGRGEVDIQALKVVTSKVIPRPNGKSVVVIVIGRVILHDDQLARLKRSKVGYSTWQRSKLEDVRIAEPSTALGTELSGINRDVFGEIITKGTLSGRSLLGMCMGDARMKLLCDRDDQALFKRLLKAEFNYEWTNGYATESPRELYAKFHNLRIDVYLIGSNIGNWRLVENGEAPKSAGLRDYLESMDRISVPLEGWFAQNAKAPSQFPQTSRSLVTRWVVSLFYVSGHPETVTLVRADWINGGLEIETSNNWFKDYFKGKKLTADGFQNLRDFFGSPEGIIRSVLRTGSKELHIKILLDQAPQTVGFFLLEERKVIG